MELLLRYAGSWRAQLHIASGNSMLSLAQNAATFYTSNDIWCSDGNVLANIRGNEGDEEC